MKDFIIACQFLTRITINPTIEVSKGDMATSTRMYPVVGFMIGALLTLIYLVFSWLLPLPTLTIAIFLIVAEVLLTGGLHLDGLMDCADGLLSYRPKERIIAIMKDSTVGANAVIALVSLLLVKTGLLVALLPENYWILLLMPLVSRWTLLYVAVSYPYAGKEGSLGGTVIGQAGDKQYRVGTTYALLLSSLIGMLVLKVFNQALFSVFLTMIVLWLSAVFTAHLVANGATRKIEGVTGDVLGAILEITEVMVLFIAVILISI